MDLEKNKIDTRYLRAKKRVEELKGFYIHLAVYIIINSIISGFKVIHDMEDGYLFSEIITDFNTLSLWLWWGIGIAFHTYKVFGARLLFLGKDWEDRKIKEYMNEK